MGRCGFVSHRAYHDKFLVAAPSMGGFWQVGIPPLLVDATVWGTALNSVVSKAVKHARRKVNIRRRVPADPLNVSYGGWAQPVTATR